MNQAMLIRRSGELLSKPKGDWNLERVCIRALSPDGSSRRFFRLLAPGEAPLLAILPPTEQPQGLAEARSVYCIGRHLASCGVFAPRILAWDAASGLVLCEDLGDQRLFEAVADQGPETCLQLYEQAVRLLAQMQVQAARNFDPSWCWDTPRYDQALMMERESGYFLTACCANFFQLSYDPKALTAECAHLANEAARAPAHFFLHRDFQCRNLMARQGRIYCIDFQGGRLGPLAYDLASLLLDPYAALPQSLQEQLMQRYLDALLAEIPYDREQFQREYFALSLQRNLQILGAFAFLTKERGKPFFAPYLRPALASLNRLLAEPAALAYPGLRALSLQCTQELEKRHEP